MRAFEEALVHISRHRTSGQAVFYHVEVAPQPQNEVEFALAHVTLMSTHIVIARENLGHLFPPDAVKVAERAARVRVATMAW